MAVIATGFFDGVHLGHRRVVEALVSFARRTGGEAVVVTFAQHPRAVLQQDARSLRLLTSAEEKEAARSATDGPPPSPAPPHGPGSKSDRSPVAVRNAHATARARAGSSSRPNSASRRSTSRSSRARHR